MPLKACLATLFTLGNVLDGAWLVYLARALSELLLASQPLEIQVLPSV